MRELFPSEKNKDKEKLQEQLHSAFISLSFTNFE